MINPSGAVIRLDGVGLAERSGRRGRRHGGEPIVAHPLRNINLELPEGGFRWLTGPAGAGKSALLAILSTMVAPTEGRVRLLGVDVARARGGARAALRRRIGVIRDTQVLLPALTGFENVGLRLRIAGLRAEAASRDAAEMLDWVGLGARMHVPAGLLSRSERQLCCIARAVVGRPAILLADEPAAFLSDAEAARLMRLLAEMNRLGTTLVVASRSETLSAAHPAPAIRLRSGRIVTEERATATTQPAPLRRVEA